jgi:hypothetical protein
MKIQTTVDIEADDIIGLICTAAEGGMSNQWARYMEGKLPKNADLSEVPEGWHPYPRYFAPFAGGVIVLEVEDAKGGEDYEVEVDMAALEKAMKLMASEYPSHFADFMDENMDAVTGDVFLQLAVYEEVIFG